VTSSENLNWRLTARFASETHAGGVFSEVMARGSVGLAASRLKDGFVVRHEGVWLRIYGDSEQALRRGQAVVASVSEDLETTVEEEVEHRAGEDAEWTAVELSSLPATGSELLREHHGRGPWGSETEPNRVQAHFELESRHAAKEFARELEADGYDVHHAGSWIFLFADDAKTAKELGETLKSRAPAGAQLYIEGEVEGTTLFI
jgi:hypothetical protein